MKLGIGFVLSFLQTSALAQPTSDEVFVGNWVMHIYLRDKTGAPRLFEDRLQIKKDQKGKIVGELTVPQRFTVPIQNLIVTGTQFSFHIQADEGHGKFEVTYEGTMHADQQTFIGFGTVTAPENELLGGFVGQKLR